jgi:hypothetical protein
VRATTKRNEVRRLCYILVNRSGAHFAPVDETVIRLVIRCKNVEWIREEGDEQDPDIEQKLKQASAAVSSPPDDKEVAKKLLGMSIVDDGADSNLSVHEVSAKIGGSANGSGANGKAKPMVPAPRRRKGKAAPAPPPNSKEVSATGNGNGTGNELKVPSAVLVRETGGSADEGGKSPFADDMAEEEV